MGLFPQGSSHALQTLAKQPLQVRAGKNSMPRSFSPVELHQGQGSLPKPSQWLQGAGLAICNESERQGLGAWLEAVCRSVKPFLREQERVPSELSRQAQGAGRLFVIALDLSTAQTPPPSLTPLTASGSLLHHSGRGLLAGASAYDSCCWTKGPESEMPAKHPMLCYCYCCCLACLS